MNLVIAALTALWAYFSKNGGLNTVSGGVLGSFLTLLVMGLQKTATIDQLITWLQNQGEYGLLGGAIVAGLRTAVLVYKASKKL